MKMKRLKEMKDTLTQVTEQNKTTLDQLNEQINNERKTFQNKIDTINNELSNKEKEFAVLESRKDAIFAAIVDFARKNDTVILAGKGHETYEIDLSGKHSFDERAIALEALGKRDMKIRQERT